MLSIYHAMAKRRQTLRAVIGSAATKQRFSASPHFEIPAIESCAGERIAAGNDRQKLPGRVKNLRGGQTDGLLFQRGRGWTRDCKIVP